MSDQVFAWFGMLARASIVSAYDGLGDSGILAALLDAASDPTRAQGIARSSVITRITHADGGSKVLCPMLRRKMDAVLPR